MSMRIVELSYRRKASVETVRAEWKGEDERYIYLANERYVKTRVVSFKTITPEKTWEEEE